MMGFVKKKAELALAKYVFQISQEKADIHLMIEPEQFSLKDPKLDDAYMITVVEGEGKIVASNERSLLLGVYHFLRECGCSFVRPGKENERIPKRFIKELSVNLKIVCAHRYRGICIEGSCNLEDTLALIEWMPKVGFNTYFMQFREGYQFFEWWYKSVDNKSRENWPFDLTIEKTLLPPIIACAKENGLSYQGVGHGFTCECFGIAGLGWMEIEEWPKNYQYALAMRQGIRDMAYNIPLISALCYSNPDVQKRIVTKAVDYISLHPELDAVHFWLDDGNNNKCECENCKDTRVADFYVQILNQLDEELTKQKLEVQLVFLAYHETLWPPLLKKIKNPNRFIFMFAPIQRSFTEGFPSIDEAPQAKEYCLNQQPFPQNNREAASFLKDWNDYLESCHFDKSFSFDFDYYLNNFGDPGQFFQAAIIYEDVRKLKNNGLNGVINCQIQRLFGHASLPIFVLAQTLVDPDQEFENIVSEFFKGAFG